MNYQVEGVILKAWDLREYDRIYEIFSKEKGKTRIIAKGVRKIKAKLACGLEPITFSRIFLFNGRNFDRVVGVLILEQYQEIKKDIERMHEVNQTIQILRNFIEDQESNEKVFNIFLNFLKFSCENKNNLNKFFFLWQLIKNSGYQHSWYNCEHCKNKLIFQENHFFIPLKGVTCYKCQKFNKGRMKISKDCIKVLRLIDSNQFDLIKKINLNKKLLNELRFITKSTLERIIGKQVYL